MEIKSHPSKSLQEHLSNVGKRAKELISNLELKLSIAKKKELEEIAYLSGIAHDFGKATSYFQRYLKNEYSGRLSHHGLISAIFGYVLADAYLIRHDSLIPIVVYTVVKRHHGNLEYPGEKISNFSKDLRCQFKDIDKENSRRQLKKIYNFLLENYRIDLDEVWEKTKKIIFSDVDDFILFDIEENLFCSDLEVNSGIELFLITNLLFSVLIDSDKKEATGINENFSKKELNIDISVNKYIEFCQKSQPEKFDPNKEINILKNKFFNEAKSNEKLDSKNKIYTLTAPTGIGKTFTAFGVAEKLQKKIDKKKRIIYSLPFTSIIDQNSDEIKKIISYNLNKQFSKSPAKFLFVHHHLAPIALPKNENLTNDSQHSIDYSNYLDDKLLLESWESAIIITTFIQLFHSIIGNKNSFLKKFHNIVNSIIILDEIQNIPPEYYEVIRKIFLVLSNCFDTYFIFMTATQPEIFKSKDSIELVEYEKYFDHQIFNRVKLYTINSLQRMSIDCFFQYFKKKFSSRNGLIVCNTKKSAKSVYKLIINEPQFNPYKKYCLTTYLIPKHRQEMIKDIQENILNNKNIIVVSTQLIEAGVDLSFAEVFRDIGPFDSMVQVAGRCNRNNELFPRRGNMFVFHLSEKNEKGENYDPSSIYSKVLIQRSRELIKNQKELNSSDFLHLSESYFRSINYKRKSMNLINAICGLNYSQPRNNEFPVNKFALIKNNPQEESIIICTEREVEKLISKINEIYEKLKNSDKFQVEQNILFGELDNIKRMLSMYIINIFSHDLYNYYNTDIIKEIRSMKYISYKDQQEYAYDKNIGFLKEPKKVISSIAIY
ncbi:MAG: CRISPR-associated helicase Cas3' [Candidatus Lokiarchaeota archaeon]|nr:CRISPR-associated helicase Cas3' [Candidatus Lokiarchaeota archaeon]